MVRCAVSRVRVAPRSGLAARHGVDTLAGVVDPDTNALDPDGVYVYPFPPAGHTTPPGTILRYVNAGAGGWGDPRERATDRVAKDLREGRISEDATRKTYGHAETAMMQFKPGATSEPAAMSAKQATGSRVN